VRITAKAAPLFLLTLLCTAGCDYASKRLAVAALGPAGSVSVAGDALRLELTSNPGAFLSLGAGLPEGVRNLLFVGIAPLLALWLCVRLLQGGSAPATLRVGIGLIAGGGLANWLDRVLHGGEVTDFIRLGAGVLHTGVFNLADVAVVTGVAVLVSSTRWSGEPSRGRAP
jgi:signal peptidase II